MATTEKRPVHIGRNISKIRDLRGMKQETLAEAMKSSQQTISRIEGSEEIEEEILAEIAKILGVTPEAIKSFNDENVINYFNTFNDNSFNNGAYNAFSCNFNPIEKLMQVVDENKALYERLLQSEQEKVDILRKSSKG